MVVGSIAIRIALVGALGWVEFGAAQSKSPRQIARDAFSSVVLLVVQDSSGQAAFLGSGFVLRNGLVATNYHVISGGSAGYCRVVGNNVSYEIAGTVAVDVVHDLAIVAISGLQAPPLPIGDSGQVAVGDTVYAVGSPEGLEGTFSQGIVSGIRDVGDGKMLQITAPISPGSSGGPVLDGSGRVVGIASATFREGQNLNLAVPSSRLVALSAGISVDVLPLRHAPAGASSAAQPRSPGDASPSVAELRGAAERGDANAQFGLGRKYLMGEGVPKDHTQALKWYRKAADLGDASAEAVVGSFYDGGDVVAKDAAEAFKWYRKAADQGDSFGEAGLGTLYGTGRGVPRDEAEALKWIRRSAEHGSAIGQAKLGAKYALGIGVPEDHTEAAKWTRKAAERGYILAQAGLAGFYLRGLGVPKDPAQAAKWFREAADQGDAASCRSLGNMYFEGTGVPQSYSESLKWYRNAADQGDAGGQVGVGLLYALGRGVPQDFVEAAKWYRKAASQGSADAQFKLGQLYENASWSPVEYVESAKWLRKAAELGHGRAQFLLGMHYRFGAGVPQDYVRAHIWLNLSAAADDELQAEAAKQRDEVAALMTREQVAEAQRLAREWKPLGAN